MLEVHRSETARDLDALAYRLAVEPHDLVFAHAPAVVVGGLFAHALDLLGAGRQVEHATFVVAGIDALGGADDADLVDGVEHRSLHGDSLLAAVVLLDGLQRSREEGRDPAAVTTRGAEADDVLLEHDDAQTRVGLGQVIGRPQAGEAAADDGDIDVERARKRRPRLKRIVDEIEPHAAPAIARVAAGPLGAILTAFWTAVDICFLLRGGRICA